MVSSLPRQSGWVIYHVMERRISNMVYPHSASGLVLLDRFAVDSRSQSFI